MSSYLPRSDADRFWAAVTALTIGAIVWLILAVGPDSAIAPHASGNALAWHGEARPPVVARTASDHGRTPASALRPSARAKITKS